MKHDATKDVRYREQQRFLNEVANRLGVICYRPDYHAKVRDANTVLFYTVDDERFNRTLDLESAPFSAPSEMYKKPFWSFENTDINGMFDYGFVNFGKLDIRSSRWKEILEGEIRLAFIRRKRHEYITGTGGYWALREADNALNHLNREELKAFLMRHGKAYLGNINFYDEDRMAIQNGSKSVYEEYTGGNVYNFSCCFCVPVQDPELERMIREWNSGSWPLDRDLVSEITDRVGDLGGIHLIWT